MNALITGHAARIRELHAEAQMLAESAIERALEAGQLLAEVKAKLPHGDFGAWVEESCGFTARTAQRYMRLHEHRGLLPDGTGVKAALAALKSDTVSHLDTDVLVAAHDEVLARLARSSEEIAARLETLQRELDAEPDIAQVARIRDDAQRYYVRAVEIRTRAERGAGLLLACKMPDAACFMREVQP